MYSCMEATAGQAYMLFIVFQDDNMLHLQWYDRHSGHDKWLSALDEAEKAIANLISTFAFLVLFPFSALL